MINKNLMPKKERKKNLLKTITSFLMADSGISHIDLVNTNNFFRS